MLHLSEAAASEPLTSADASLRAQLRIADDETDENELIDHYCAAARGRVEALTGQRLITQDVQLVLGDWPSPTDYIPVAPVQSVGGITYTDSSGAEQSLPASEYRLDTAGALWRLRPALNSSWPSIQYESQIVITLTVGFGADGSEVPSDLLQAMRMLVGHYFINREAVAMGSAKSELPETVQSLCNGWRIWV